MGMVFAVEVTGALVVVVLSREVSALASVPAPRVDVVESAARAPTSVAVTSVDRACTPSTATSPKVDAVATIAATRRDRAAGWRRRRRAGASSGWGEVVVWAMDPT